MISNERRSSRRFLLKIPLTVSWNDEGDVRNAATESQDVSSRGLYFRLPRKLRSGAAVEIEMPLPGELTEARPERVRCFGHVLRCSTERPGEVGVAVMIDRYELMSAAAAPEPRLENLTAY